MAFISNTTLKHMGITIDGSGSVISTGLKQYMIVPFGCTIIGWTIIGDTIGSCVIDVWKSSSIPISSDTISGSQIPTLSGQQSNSSTSVSTWTTNINSGDIIAFNVNSVSSIKKVTLTLIARLKI